MNEHELGIGIIYGKNSFDSQELLELRDKLDGKNVSLIAREKSPYINAALDVFVPFVEVLLSPEIIKLIVQGILPAAIWDAIKLVTSTIFKKFHSRKITRIQGGNITEETPNIHFSIGNNHLVLPVDIDEEKYQYAIDRFMEYSTKSIPAECTIIWYSEKSGKLDAKTESQIIQEEVVKQRNRNKVIPND